MAGPRLELKPTPESLAIVFGVFASFAGPLIVAGVLFGPSWLKLVSLAGAASGIALYADCARQRLILDEEGITRRGPWRTRAIRWDDVERYTFWSIDRTYLAAGGEDGAGGGALRALVVGIFGPEIWRGSKNRQFMIGRLTIWSHAGDRIAIVPQFREAAVALDRAFEALHARLRTRERDFTPFTLGEADLHHATEGSLALADIGRIVVGRSHVVVHRRGTQPAWARARMAKVHNLMLLLEELAGRGLIVDTGRDVFVPPAVLGELQATASRQAALPRAKVVQRN